MTRVYQGTFTGKTYTAEATIPGLGIQGPISEGQDYITTMQEVNEFIDRKCLTTGDLDGFEGGYSFAVFFDDHEGSIEVREL